DIPNELPGITGVGACRKWIVDGHTQSAQIAIELRRRGNKERSVRCLVVAESLIGKEEKRLVPAVVELGKIYRSSDLCSKLVLFEIRLRRTRRRESRYRIKYRVSRKLPSRTMKLIGPRLGYHIYHAAQDAAKFGAVGMRNDFEFLDGIDNRRHCVRAQNTPVVVQSIGQVEVASISLSVHRGEIRSGPEGNRRSREPAAIALSRVHRGHTRCQL